MDTYFYYFNHANNQENHHLSGDCSCSCLTCLYKLDLIFLLIVIYLLLMDKITININSIGPLPLVPMDNNDNTGDGQFDVNNFSESLSSSVSDINQNESKSSSSTNENLESLNSIISSSSSTLSAGRKLIKPDISLDFLDLDEDENSDSLEKSFSQDYSLSEENFTNTGLSTFRLSSFSCRSFNRHHKQHHYQHNHHGVKRQSSLDSSDSISFDSGDSSSSSSSGYSSLPCNLIDNVYVHEAGEVNCPFNLSLTFTELGHIRKALAREELDSMSFTQKVRDELIRGKLCSTCLKTRFRLFGPWADCCRLCERPVCSRCSSNVQINAKRYNSIPIQLLVPNKNQRQITKSSRLKSSSSLPTTVIAKIKVTQGHQKQSSINTGHSSLSKNQRSRFKSLPWIKKTNHDNPSTDDDNNNEDVDDDDDDKHTMLIKLCLDCEQFFLSLLTI